MLGALILALDDDSAGYVCDADRRIGLVDVLAARARGTIGVDAQIGRIEIDFFHLIELRQDGNRACRRVNTPLRLGGRNTLHAVGARLEFQPREDAPAGNAADDLAVS